MYLIQGSRAKYQPDGGRFVLNPVHFLEDRLLRLCMQLQGYAPRHMSSLSNGRSAQAVIHAPQHRLLTRLGGLIQKAR